MTKSKTTRTAKPRKAAKKTAARKSTARKSTAASVATPKTKAYPAFYKYARPARKVTPDTRGDELQAVSRGPDALKTLRSFLKQYTPANEEYQDAFHRNRVRAARFELMRLEYLQGHVAAGDKLLALLQDVDGDDE